MGRPTTRVPVTCRRCGTAFDVTPANLARGQGKYCSQACFHAANVGHPNYHIKPADERACVVCGTTFLVGGQNRPPRTQVMCSLKCQRRARYRHGSRAKALSVPDAAYIAGIVDGEGSIFFERRRKGVHLRLVVSNTDKALLDWLIEVTGIGNIVAHHGDTAQHRASWNWVCASEAAETVLEQIRPYMRIKTDRADIALACQARLRIPADKADHSWQEEAREQIRLLNKRGPRTA